jgi:hypothetical protein
MPLSITATSGRPDDDNDGGKDEASAGPATGSDG